MPLFAGLTPVQLEDVAGTVLDRRVKPGKTVIKAGNWGHEFVLVLEGEVDVLRDGAGRRHPRPRQSRRGDRGARRRAAATPPSSPRRPVVIGAIDTGLFRALLREIPVLAERIAAAAARGVPTDASQLRPGRGGRRSSSIAGCGSPAHEDAVHAERARRADVAVEVVEEHRAVARRPRRVARARA